MCVAPACTDHELNGNETSLDCGGGECVPCEVMSRCEAASDCESGVCAGDVCTTTECTDSSQNGSESDVDCGGDDCPRCGSGRYCSADSDCLSSRCSPATADGEQRLCLEPECDDEVANGRETDLDCGGACEPCANGKQCRANEDCQSGSCRDFLCVSARCDDGVRNGNETDVDCGGAVCGPCGTNQECATERDCDLWAVPVAARIGVVPLWIDLHDCSVRQR